MKARIVEVSGKTVDEAVARALAQIGLTRDQVDVDVVSEGRGGFLGIGSEEAVVRVTAKQSAGSSSTASRTEGTGGSSRRRGRRGGRGRGRGRGGAGGEGEGEGQGQGQGSSDEPPLRSDVGNQSQDGRRGGRPDRGGRSRGRRRGGTPITGEIRIPGQPPEPPVPAEEWEDSIDFAGRTIRDLLDLLGLTETEIRARDPETAGDGVGRTEQVFDIVALNDDTANELGGLIGRRGQTLTSLQYLVNVISARRQGGDHVFTVDVEGYRQRRERSLVEMAREIADEVRDSGDVITLEPLSAAERRIIHLAIEGEEDVRSESVGEGEDRQVEVLPE